jgi:hypothetical protein
MNELFRELATALRIHHEWCIVHQPGYSEHGADAVAYRSTAALLERAAGVEASDEAELRKRIGKLRTALQQLENGAGADVAHAALEDDDAR